MSEEENDKKVPWKRIIEVIIFILQKIKEGLPEEKVIGLAVNQFGYSAKFIKKLFKKYGSSKEVVEEDESVSQNYIKNEATKAKEKK